MRILDTIEHLRTSLDYHLARHNLLTANLAHVDTPNFKPLDLQRTSGDFHAALSSELARTDDQHLAGTQASASAAQPWKVTEDPTATAGIDGNAVNVEREAVKIAANHTRYDAIASLTTGELSGLAWAANDGRSG